MTAPTPQAPAILTRMRQATRRRGPPPKPPENVVDYDWSRPHHFTAGQRGRLEAAARQIADHLGKALGPLLRSDTGFVAKPVDECFPSAVDPPDRPAYYVPLRSPDNAPVGGIRFPAPLAAAWVESLLGGTTSARTEVQDLSPLEAGLLLDIAAAMVKAISGACTAAGGTALRHEPSLATWAEALPVDPAEELCRLSFRSAKEDASAAVLASVEAVESAEDAFQKGRASRDDADEAGADEAGAPAKPAKPVAAPAAQAEETAPTLLLTSAFLAPLAQDAPASADDVTPDEIQARIASRIEAAPVTVVAELGSASIAVGDFFGLEPGDVIVLERTLDEPITLTVDGQPVARAKPACCGGHYAVEVQDLRRYPRLGLTV